MKRIGMLTCAIFMLTASMAFSHGPSEASAATPSRKIAICDPPKDPCALDGLPEATVADLFLLKTGLYGNFSEPFDLDCDGIINSVDLNIMRIALFSDTCPL